MGSLLILPFAETVHPDFRPPLSQARTRNITAVYPLVTLVEREVLVTDWTLVQVPPPS